MCCKHSRCFEFLFLPRVEFRVRGWQMQRSYIKINKIILLKILDMLNIYLVYMCFYAPRAAMPFGKPSFSRRHAPQEAKPPEKPCPTISFFKWSWSKICPKSSQASQATKLHQMGWQHEAEKFIIYRWLKTIPILYEFYYAICISGPWHNHGWSLGS